jgi:hypothetical protein
MYRYCLTMEYCLIYALSIVVLIQSLVMNEGSPLDARVYTYEAPAGTKNGEWCVLSFSLHSMESRVTASTRVEGRWVLYTSIQEALLGSHN